MEQDFDMRRPEEAVMVQLRRLYELFGYRKYKVSNFEEYSLYLQYKSFLSGDKILSFTDLDGRLLALRPDVTLSIIKNAREGETAKAYYLEKVYRESKESNTFKEINQMGLEYMGDVDSYGVAEVVYLARESLAACCSCCNMNGEYILELGHMGFVLGLLDKLELNQAEREEVMACLAARSPHRLRALADDMGLSSADRGRLLALLELSGEPEQVLSRAEELCSGRRMQRALAELAEICGALKELGKDKEDEKETDKEDDKEDEKRGRLRLDLCLLNSREFYDGILLCGYLAGLPRPVLSGGRYDSMMYKLGHDMEALGFALYLDELERLPLPPREFDLDLWLEPEPGAATGELLRAAERLTEEGVSVRVARVLPPELRAARHLRFAGGELLEVKDEEAGTDA